MTDITCISPIDGTEVARRPIASDAEIAAASADVEGKTEMDALIAYLQGLGTASKEWK